jgi:integrase
VAPPWEPPGSPCCGFGPACAGRGLTKARARRRVLIPSIPQVLRLAAALDHFKPGLGDVAMVLAFTGLRWEEAVAVPVDNVDLDGQCMTVDRTASESGGRRDVRNDMKTRAAVRVVMIPDIAMPAVRRLLERGAAGREQSGGTRYSRLINGERGGYIGYAMWRRYLALAHGYTASHQDGMVKYTAHELRHVCASLLIASGASDVQVVNQMGTARSRRPLPTSLAGGADLQVVRQRLGHGSLRTTEKYLNPRVLHQAGEKSQVTRSRRYRNSVSTPRTAAV